MKPIKIKTLKNQGFLVPQNSEGIFRVFKLSFFTKATEK